MVATFDYDGFGRKGLEVRPDGTRTTIVYETRPTGYAISTFTPGAANSYTDYDRLGREIRAATTGFGGRWIFRNKAYDALGRLGRQSRPYFENEPAYDILLTHDTLGRARTVTEPGPGNRATTTDHAGLTTTVTNPLGQTKTVVNNSQGKPVAVTETFGSAAAGTTSYHYDAFGNLTRVTDPLGNVSAMQYDRRGRKIAMQDPDMGAWTYGYNVLSELIRQTDAKGQTTTMSYDALGRLTARTAPEGVSQWTYDTAIKGIGKLARLSDPNYQEQHSYDSLSRPVQVDTTINWQTFSVITRYDAVSRVQKIIYPTGYQVLQIYDAYGHLEKALKFTPAPGEPSPVDTLIGTQTLLWQTDYADAQSRITQERFGNGVIGQRLYHPETGDLAAILAGSGGANIRNLQDLSYTFETSAN